MVNKETIKHVLPAWLTDVYTSCHFNIIFAKGYIDLKRQRAKHHYQHKKIHIVFIVQRTEIFNSVRSIFEAMVKDGSCDIFFLPLPRCANKGEGFYWDSYNTVVDFCKKLNYGTVIESYNFERHDYFDIAKIEPDFIFLNVPYTSHYPEVYQIRKLAVLAPVCYVPYGYSMMEGHLPSIYFSQDFSMGVEYIFASSNLEYDFGKKYLKMSELLTKKRIYRIGYTRFDLIEKTAPANNSVLWLPRWTTGTGKPGDTEKSSFLPFYKEFLRYAAEHLETDFIIRPHPLMFENFLKNGVMSEDEIGGLLTEIEQTKNVYLDIEPDYLSTFNKAAILLSDFSSLLAEYYYTGRPIIYFGTTENFEKYESQMLNSFYTVRNWNETRKCLDKLLVGCDERKNIRLENVKQFSSHINGNIGQRIFNILKDAYRESNRISI